MLDVQMMYEEEMEDHVHLSFVKTESGVRRHSVKAEVLSWFQSQNNSPTSSPTISSLLSTVAAPIKTSLINYIQQVRLEVGSRRLQYLRKHPTRWYATPSFREYFTGGALQHC